MKRALWKLQDAAGETLIELLASILVGSLSVLVLVTMIVTSARINDSIRDIDEDYYKYLSAAEMQDPSGEITSEDDTLIVIQAGTNEIKIPVTYYGGGSIFSYKIKTP